MPDDSITRFARTNFRGSHRLFGIRLGDRFSHMHILGKTGTGKSTLLETLACEDLRQRHGLLLIDPHGDLASRVAEAATRFERPFLNLDLSDPACQVSFNPLSSWEARYEALAVSALIDAFRKVWVDSWGARLEYILRNALFTLIAQPGSTLPDILHLFTDAEFRREAVERVTNPPVRAFWETEFQGYKGRFRLEAITPIQNKVGALLSHPSLHRLLTAPRSSFDPRALMDSGGVLLVNLGKGRIGEDAASLLGSLLVSQFAVAGLSRADLSEDTRRPFFIHLDEFPSFATATLATILSELRKYRVGLVLAHQYLTQLELGVREAVLGNAGTLIAFRLGVSDARLLAREFFPRITPEDLINLPNRAVYLRLMISGEVSKPFSAETVVPGEVQS